MTILAGRAAAAHISREKAEALSCAAKRGRGVNSPAVERKGGRSGEGHSP